MLLLDLFCGAGGAAMGYAWAGFDVIGIDVEPQPRYPFEFHQMDWREGLRRFGSQVDAIHASPPCQGYSAMNRAVKADHDLLISATREALLDSGRPWVIENVEGAHRYMRDPTILCGTHFGLRVRRHRLFETSFCLLDPGPHSCRLGVVEGRLLPTRRGGKPAPGRRRPPPGTETEYRNAMEVYWMTIKEARQVIPPAYTRYVGRHLREHFRKLA